MDEKEKRSDYQHAAMSGRNYLSGALRQLRMPAFGRHPREYWFR